MCCNTETKRQRSNVEPVRWIQKAVCVFEVFIFMALDLYEGVNELQLLVDE